MKNLIVVIAAALLLPAAAWAAPGDLAKAAMNNDIAEVTKLLAAGADANDRYGKSDGTALMFAAQNGNAAMVRALIAAGADVKATRPGSFFALHHAAAAGTPEVVSAVLEAGAALDAKTEKGATPLQAALNNGRFDNAELLLQRGADLRAIANYEEALAWAIAAPGPNTLPAPLLPRSLIDRLIAAGADPSKAKGGALALLHSASQNFQPEAIPVLIAHGADINGTDGQGNTSLLLACEDIKYEDVLGGYGSFGLMANILDVKPAKVVDSRILVKSLFLTPELPPLLKGIGFGFGDVKGEMADISRRRAATIAALIAAGADVKRANNRGETPVYALGDSFDGASMKVLLDAGGDPLAAAKVGDPPLHRAAEGGYTDALKAMLSAGANPNARNSDNQTPLMLAAISGGDVEVTIALLEANADVAARDKKGNTALHYAVGAEEENSLTKLATENGQLEPVVKVLLAKGADPLARNNARKTPRDLIKSPKYQPAMALLREAETSKN
jgi:ankyrin repeat protein